MAWRGQTYYGRAQLKAAPFNAWAVGGYIALAGLSGASSLLGAVADLAGPPEAAGTVRRARYVPLLAPTLGAGLLVWDLHTPQRFYNMLRVAKATSPMSIGTWILSGFSVASGATALLQRAGRRRAARAANLPAAALGMGMATYTAALLAATSTPLWAAAPRALGVRFGAASVASAAALLSLMERRGATRRALDGVCGLALAVELAAEGVQRATLRREGMGEIARPMERAGVVGAAVPLALLVLSGLRGGAASRVATGLVLGGSLLLRVSTLVAGGRSAEDPVVSLGFTQRD